MGQAFFGQVDLDSDHDGITINGWEATYDGGEPCYVWSPVNAESYCYWLATTMSTIHGETVTITISGGIATITATTTLNITDWQNYAALGFTTDTLIGSNTYTATNQLKYCWFPGIDASNSLASILVQGTDSALVSQAVAPDGTVYTSKWGTLVTQELTFSFISYNDTWPDADNPDNRSFQEFWESTLSEGRGFLFVPYYGELDIAHEYVADLKDPGMMVERQIPGTDVYWKATIKARGV